MKKILIILFMLYSGILYSQKNYINYNTMLSSQYIGIGWERSYLNRTISHEIGIGLLGGSLSLRGYIGNDKYRSYIGCTHLIQFVPSVAGWKTFPHIGISKEVNNTRIGLDIGPRLQWWDRKAYMDLGVGIKFSKMF